MNRSQLEGAAYSKIQQSKDAEFLQELEPSFAICEAALADTQEITEIYNSEVGGVSHYALEPESPESRALWLQNLQKLNLPILVAKVQNKVIGFGALTPFHPAAGYGKTVSGQLYLHKQWRAKGIGTALARQLIQLAGQRSIKTILAGINSRNHPSIRLHEALGFEKVGYFKCIGYKNGEWQDDVCMQLILDTTDCPEH